MDEVSVIYKVLAAIGATLGSGTAGWTWYDRGRRDKKMDTMEVKLGTISNKQTEHENKFITEQRTREIFREEVAPLRGDVTYIKAAISEMKDSVNQLSTQLAISNAVSEALKDRKNSS